MPAHLTMFRSLPQSAQEEVRRSLSRAASAAAPAAEISAVMDLDGGVALRIASPELETIREQLAAEFRGLLSAQDTGGWTAHVTVQNKVDACEAGALLRAMRAGFEPRPVEIMGLELVRYAQGAWEPVARYGFRGPRSSRRRRRS